MKPSKSRGLDEGWGGISSSFHPPRSGVLSPVKAETKINLGLVLLLLPYLVTVLYGIYAWSKLGLGLQYPEEAYLEVTKNPYLFLFSSFLTLVAVTLFITGFEEKRRIGALKTISQVLTFLGLFSLISAYIIGAWSGGGLAQGASLLLEGRYASIYPLILFFTSFMLNLPPVKDLGRAVKRWTPLLLFLTIPIYYLVAKRFTDGWIGFIGLLIGMIFLIILVILSEKLSGGEA